MRIADKIKEIRLQKYLSMREFGNALGVSKATISRWEKGSHRPSVGAIKAIADFANVPVDEFYDEQKHGRSVLGRKIGSIRLEKGMTTKEFGKLFGSTDTNVTSWEQGSYLPNGERLKMIAQLGELTVDELLEKASDTEIEHKLVGQRIKQIRRQYGLTLIEFGKALNVNNVTVCRWENGQRMPNVFTILKIAKMGNMTVEEFLS